MGEACDRSRGREDGAVAVVAALLLTVLLLFAAFVIDLGAMRVDRALEQSVSDMAVTAAAQLYAPSEAGSARAACLEAVAFAEVNLERTLTPEGPGCEVFPVGGTCDGVVRQAVYTAGDFTVTIVNPVPDGPGLMGDVSYGSDVDGQPCDRIGVRVERERQFILAGAGGAVTRGSSAMGAVARSSSSGSAEALASLIVLQAEGCATLEAIGTAKLRVASATYDGVDYPGIITIDTVRPSPLGSCNNERIIRMNGASNEIVALGPDGGDGHIFSYALQVDPADSWVYPTSPSTPQPTPTPGSRVTRAPVDHVYNCVAYGGPEPWQPDDAITAPIPDCTDDGEPYVRDLHAAYQSMTASTVPVGWGVISNNAALRTPGAPNCGNSGPPSTYTLSVPTRWFVDCDVFSPRSSVSFVAADAVVVRGRIDLAATSTLRIDGGANGAILYVQAQGAGADTTALETRGSSEIDLVDTFVYLDAGVIDTAGTSTIRWRAPLSTSTSCTWTPGTAPSGGCLAPLALWSNSSAPHRLQGTGALDIAGSFFTPNAQPFRVGGTGDQTLAEAQFFAAHLRVFGNGTITMVPNPTTNVPLRVVGGGLIR